MNIFKKLFLKKEDDQNNIYGVPISKLKKSTPSPFDIELERVKKAVAYMNEWRDMPMEYLHADLCKILNVGINKASYDFCIVILIHNYEHSAEQLLNIRK